MADEWDDNGWSDADDDVLSEAVEKYEKSNELLKIVTDHEKDKLETPLKRFRPGYLWVSDFTRQSWCEQQMYYSFTVPTIFEENPIMTEGSNLHLARELAVHDVVKIKVTSNEDIWAVKVINLITALQTMLNGGTIVREVPVFGCPFEKDVLIVGLVDELQFDPETFKLSLSEFKTRRYRSFPSKSQQNQHRLQVMLYKKLFDDLVKGKLYKEAIAKHLRVDLQKQFGDDIQTTIDSKFLSSKNLCQLLDELFLKIQCFTCVQDLGVEYQHQESKDFIGKHSISYDEEQLQNMFEDYMNFWQGKREVKGVDIEEAFKCQSCDFADICDWRKRKAEECSKANTALDCYQCSNVRNMSDCHQTTLCTDNEFCFTDTIGFGDQTRFNMGCRDQSVCAAQTTTTTTSPLSIIGRATTQDLECTQCCGVDACNKHICTTGTHAVAQNSECADDPNFDCAKIGSVFDVCSNKEHAKLVCREFCGLCEAVDGGWSSWKSWSNCDTSCGNGTMARTRVCDNPTAKHGGLPCIGSIVDTQACNLRPCPVDGEWSMWSGWDSCSISCGIGVQSRTRNCSNPPPSLGGFQCPGGAIDAKACFLRSCADGVWSVWSSWSTCSQSCLGGLSTRQRQCNSPLPSTFGHDCVGSNQDYKICNSIPCQVYTVIGHWSSWSSWASCSVSCGGGLKRRTRTCNNPTANQNGLVCVGNSEDVSVCSIFNCPGASLARLVGPTHYEGRLEVFYNGGWGTVCDDSFSDVDAQVTCRMMNLPWSGAIALPSAFYGRGSLPIKLDDVGCSSSNSNLFDCSFAVSDNCNHGEDVGVACYPPLQIRLRGGSSSHNGRIEVSFDGRIWGTVCDDAFTDNSAKVVCRMLGFTTNNARHSHTYGAGTGDILLDDVVCTGLESTLLKCRHNKFTSSDCGHGEDVGVICG